MFMNTLKEMNIETSLKQKHMNTNRVKGKRCAYGTLDTIVSYFLIVALYSQESV